MTQNNDQPKSNFSGLFTGSLILILHLVLIVALAMTVVFLKSLYDIRWLLLVVGLLLIAASGWFFYQRFKKSNRKLKDMMNHPALQGRSVEISLLGGIATVKLGNNSRHPTSPIQIDDQGNDIKQLEMAKPSRLNSLSELKELLDNDLITKEEFLKLKHEIMTPVTPSQHTQPDDVYVISEDEIKKS